MRTVSINSFTLLDFMDEVALGGTNENDELSKKFLIYIGGTLCVENI